MSSHRTNFPRTRLAQIAALVLVAGLSGAAQAQTITNWTKHFRIGAVVGLNMDVNFRMNGQFGISGSGQPGIFDDGYVLMDNTGNAGGYTSFWGYQNASQYDPANHTLTLHSSTSFTMMDKHRESAGENMGLDVLYGGKIMNSGDAIFSWELGFMWMPISARDQRPLATTFVQTSQVFDTGDIVVPEAPYNGGPSGIGPTIPATGTAGPGDVTPGTITGTRKLDATLYNIRLGPALHWELNKWFAFSISGGAAMGIVSSEYQYKEIITTQDGGQTSNRGHFNNTDTVFGSYANATLLFHTKEKADIFIGAQYMMLDTVSVSSEGRSASLDLGGGIYVSAGVNWPF